MKKVIAITGLIGSGKTTLMNNLSEFSPVLFVDQIQSDLYLEGGTLFNMVFEKYPEFIKNNVVDTELIKKRMINSLEFKKEFETLVIEIVLKELEKQISKQEGILLVEIPFIPSHEIKKLFDEIIVISSEFELRVKRISKRNGQSLEQSRKWAEAFVPSKINGCKEFFNNSTIEKLIKEVKEYIYA